LRLLDRGEFAAQATITNWKKVDPGQHTEPDEFKKVLQQLPNWEPEQIDADGIVPANEGHWLYRVAARGLQDGQPVVQTFYLLAGPGGDQAAVTILMRPEKIARVGTRDLALVKALTFPPRK
jgi:hypothetical protein